MIDYLRRVRVTWRQLGIVALLSAISTALVIASALGHSSTPSAVIAALSRRVVIHRHPTATTAVPVSDPGASPGTSAGTSSGDSGSGVSPGGSGGGASSAGAGSSGGSTGTSTSTPSDTGSTPSNTPTSATGSGGGKRVYKVKHVFVIALSAPDYAAAFGPHSVATYLGGTLRPRGTLLAGYRTLGGTELPDYLAMVSGQAPNSDTRGDCSSYIDFPGGAKPNAKGLVSGAGCVYPNTALTIGDQVTATGADWRAYIGDMGAGACVHPNSGALDNQPLPSAGPDYDTRHNPFIYFHSLLDLGDCATDDLGLPGLSSALRGATPRYTFIAPNGCADAATVSCAGGGAAGLAGEDAFLRAWVPQILASRAYRQSGLLVIAFAASAPPPATPGPGPVRMGALVLSPFAKRGATLHARFNAYSLLRTTEELLGLGTLGHAADAKAFIAAALPGA